MSKTVFKCSGDTRINTTSFDFSWKIHNFNDFTITSLREIESPSFIDPHLNCIWGCIFSECNNYYGLNLQLRNNCNDSEINKPFECLYDILDDNFQVIYSGRHRNEIKQKGITDIYYLSVGDLKKEINRHSPKTLMIKFQLTVVHDYSNQCQIQIPPSSYQSEVCSDLELLFKKKELTDVTLIVDGKELHAHKAILAARSSVFLAMFKNDTIKKAGKCIKITDATVDEMNELLYFLYTGKTKNIEQVAFNLLSISDKYDVGKLKENCEKCLLKKISIDNALKILILADLHNCSQLKDEVLKFIGTHKQQILKSEEYKEVKESNPKLIIDTLFSLL